MILKYKGVFVDTKAAAYLEVKRENNADAE